MRPVVLRGRLTDDTLRLLASFAAQLEHLDVACLLLLTDHGLDAATGRFPLLRSLSLGHCGRLTTGSVLRFAMRALLTARRAADAGCLARLAR